MGASQHCYHRLRGHGHGHGHGHGRDRESRRHCIGQSSGIVS